MNRKIFLALLATLALGASAGFSQGDAFVTTWDTSLGEGTTVTLALAGDVDATIDWGDGTIIAVTTPGPHVHDYGVDGVYTVSVIGRVTAYNSRDHGGAISEHKKLVSVDSWGQLEFYFLANAFRGFSNLVSVPGQSYGIEALTNQSGLFSGGFSSNDHIGNWFASSVSDMRAMFLLGQFNQDISGWSKADGTWTGAMFRDILSFREEGDDLRTLSDDHIYWDWRRARSLHIDSHWGLRGKPRFLPSEQQMGIFDRHRIHFDRPPHFP